VHPGNAGVDSRRSGAGRPEYPLCLRQPARFVAHRLERANHFPAGEGFSGTDPEVRDIRGDKQPGDPSVRSGPKASKLGLSTTEHLRCDLCRRHTGKTGRNRRVFGLHAVPTGSIAGARAGRPQGTLHFSGAFCGCAISPRFAAKIVFRTDHLSVRHPWKLTTRACIPAPASSGDMGVSRPDLLRAASLTPFG